jgi:hypothetical protein
MKVDRAEKLQGEKRKSTSGRVGKLQPNNGNEVLHNRKRAKCETIDAWVGE